MVLEALVHHCIWTNLLHYVLVSIIIYLVLDQSKSKGLKPKSKGLKPEDQPKIQRSEARACHQNQKNPAKKNKKSNKIQNKTTLRTQTIRPSNYKSVKT